MLGNMVSLKETWPRLVFSDNALQNENYGVQPKDKEQEASSAPDITGRGRLGGESSQPQAA